MALVWIVTTGNSDVKLASDDGWGDLRSKKNEQLKPCHKKFGSLIKGDDNLFSLPARVMGIIYGDTWETHEDYFRFPLLEEFTKTLRDEGKNPDRIIVLLTDQEEIFLENNDNPRYDRSEDSPYWRDTSRLEPIFKHYFDQEFGKERVEFRSLEPETAKEGLDNWDSTLELVQEEFKGWRISKDDFVIVSHQASTPAISSAVQFVSLARFGEQVDFLTCNERDANLTRFLEGSKYLKGIRKKEAEALLKRYDYSGVQALLETYLQDGEGTKILLNAAVQWNFAEFKKFAEMLEEHQDFQEIVRQRTRKDNWWWTAYEATYLALVRFRQGNTVEAIFHSFRAVEGLLRNWVDEDYLAKALRENDPRKYIHSKDGSAIERSGGKKFQAFGKDLYYFFKEIGQKMNNKRMNEHIQKFGDCIFNRRNELFHQLKGLHQLEKLSSTGDLEEKEIVFRFWEITSNSEKDWMKRTIGCLNCICDQDYEFWDFNQDKASHEAASLMVKVHQELVDAIANL